MPVRREPVQAADDVGPSGQQDQQAMRGKALNVHRAGFLQSLMSAGYMSETEAKATLKRLSLPFDDAGYRKLLADLNKELKFARLQLRTLKSPVDQKAYVAFVNMEGDDSAKMGTRYKLAQRDFFRTAMETIACAHPSENCTYASVSSMELISLDVRSAATQADPTQAGPSQAPAAVGKKVTLSKKEREETLLQLLSDGWLSTDSTRAGYYTLGVRTFCELPDMLMQLDRVPETVRTAWEEVL